MVFALASSRKSRSCCDKPFTFFNTCLRVKASMGVNVPISGVKPGCGPTIHAFSAAAEDMGERPDWRARLPFPRQPSESCVDWAHIGLGASDFLHRKCDSLEK